MKANETNGKKMPVNLKISHRDFNLSSSLKDTQMFVREN